MGFIDEVRISSIARNLEELSPKTLIPDPNLRATREKTLGENAGDAITKEDFAEVDLNGLNLSGIDLTAVDMTKQTQSFEHLNSKQPDVSTLNLSGRSSSIFIGLST